MQVSGEHPPPCCSQISSVLYKLMYHKQIQGLVGRRKTAAHIDKYRSYLILSLPEIYSEI